MGRRELLATLKPAASQRSASTAAMVQHPLPGFNPTSIEFLQPLALLLLILPLKSGQFNRPAGYEWRRPANRSCGDLRY